MMAPLAGRRIGLLTASASRQGGGVFEAVVAQAQLIGQLGGEAHVFALHDSDSDQDAARFGSVPVHTFSVTGPHQIGFAPELVSALVAARLDCLHLHGIWMYPSRAAAVWAGASDKPLIISPHGMLDPWITARGRWKKALARIGYERAAWRRAWALHALTQAEADDIAREAGRLDTIVIPNAGPDAGPPALDMPPPVLAYLGRIHPKKNLLALIDGWNAAQRPQQARLRLAGWGEPGDIAALQAACASSDRVEFLGPLFGDAKAELIAEARFMVLPSHSEGLPMAMLEAWSAARPTLMTTHCNLPKGFAAGAALDCGTDAASIAVTIGSALALEAVQWRQMATAARTLADGPFSTATVAAHWGEAYARAIAGRAPQ